MNLDIIKLSKNVNKEQFAVLGKTLDLLTQSQLESSKVTIVTLNETLKPIKPISVIKKNTSLYKTIKVSKEEMAKSCKICGIKQFNKNDFIGCLCLRDLSKNAKTEMSGDGCLITFKRKKWDNETLLTLLKNLKNA